MSVIKFKMDFERVATIKTTKGQMPVGKVKEFTQHTNGSIDLVVDLNDDLPEEVKEAIEKNPGCLGIMGNLKPVVNYIILPKLEV